MPDENVDYTYTENEVNGLVDDLSQQTIILRYQDLQAIVKNAVGELTLDSIQIPATNIDVVKILVLVYSQYLALENEERSPGESGKNKTKLQILKRFLELFYRKFQGENGGLVVSKDGFNQTLNSWLRGKGCYFTN